MIGDSLRATILASGAVAALVVARVFDTTLPQASPDVPGNFPAVTYQQVSEQRAGTFGGPDSLPGVLFQVSSWDVTKAGVQTLARQIRFQLDYFKGTVSGDVIQQIKLETESDTYFPDVKLWCRRQDYRVWWVEN